MSEKRPSAVTPLVVEEVRVYRGPHYYSETPMIGLRLQLGTLESYPTNLIEGFTQRLLTMVPSLYNHGCSYNEPGGLVRRMEEGTWMGHVIEHVALELQSLGGDRVTRGKTRSVPGTEGEYWCLFAYRYEEVGLLAGRLAIELVESCLPDFLRGAERLDDIVLRDTEPIVTAGQAVERLRQVRRRNAFGPTTASLIREADRRGIPWMRLDETCSLVQLGYGRKQKRIQASVTGDTSSVAAELAGDKDLTKHILNQAGIPVPSGKLVKSADEAAAAAAEIGFPVVVKPLDGNHGRGVSIDINSPEEAREAFERATVQTKRTSAGVVVVERQIMGDDHRMLVVGGKLVAAALRRPAHAFGDGKHTIAELVAAENLNPLRGDGHESFLTKIPLDEAVLGYLGKSGRSADTVPEFGEMVTLQPTANLSSGGTAEDVTDRVHPMNRLIAERAAQAIGLDVAGIDFMATDISRSALETGGGVIEVNAAPGLRMHLRPTKGQGRNVARPIVQSLFPKGNGRIPIIAITGTNGKTTTGRLVSEIMQAAGNRVGLTSTNGIYLDDMRIAAGDMAGPKSARMVLRDPSVDVAVLETARGGILREGLAFTQCDVGAVLNVAADHLGQKGVHTVEHLARVKAIVVESVRRGGHSVLNADDPYVDIVRRNAGGEIIYFSLKAPADWPDFLRKHVDRGGMAVIWDRSLETGQDVLLYEDGLTYPAACASTIPITVQGWAEYNVANVLAAIAMTYAAGVDLSVIEGALRKFVPSPELLPGRLNVFEEGGIKVIVDYVHNPHGLEAVGGLVKRMRANGSRAIGVISIAGDRRDEDVRKMGRLAADAFDEVIFREDLDLRGRESGVVSRILGEGAEAAGKPFACVQSEELAIQEAVHRCHMGDFVVVAVEKVDQAALTVREALAERKASLQHDPAKGERNGVHMPALREQPL
jgi:cyanophycin synthetase